MNKKISTALISVFYKDGLEPLVRQLHQQQTVIYSTGGTQKYIVDLGIPVVPVEKLTAYPSILGGRVKTLHPLVFGGILGRRNNEQDNAEMKEYGIPEIDLVIVDLYPFEETLAGTTDEAAIIEKIDIGGPSMIRGAAKNFNDVAVIAAKSDYQYLLQLLKEQSGETTLAQRKKLAAKAFSIVAGYESAISNYFNTDTTTEGFKEGQKTSLRYGENPHQEAYFSGDLNQYFLQLQGKELSYNNLVDVSAAIELMADFKAPFSNVSKPIFAIIKHTNVCGIAARNSLAEAWEAALAGDPESAFGGVLIANVEVDKQSATAINSLFFEVLMAPSFSEEAITILSSKKNRILLQLKETGATTTEHKSLLGGTLFQNKDAGSFSKWEEVGGRTCTDGERLDLEFANIICKHLKSNAIALVKNYQLVGKGCGQTSRVDALRHALEKAVQFDFNLDGAVMASDAFFPFDDCVKLGKEAGIAAFIQPGGSIRDSDSIAFCKENNLAMVLTGMRHFKH